MNAHSRADAFPIPDVRVVEPYVAPTVLFDEVRIDLLEGKYQIILLHWVLDWETNQRQLQIVGRLNCSDVTLPRLLLRETLRWCGQLPEHFHAGRDN